MAKVKRSIYRVLPITERHKLIGWKVTGPSGYTASLWRHEGGTKHGAIKLAVSLAKENQPSQVLVSAHSHKTHKVRIVTEWTHCRYCEAMTTGNPLETSCGIT